MNPILKRAVERAHQEAVEKARYGDAGSSKQRRMTAMLNRANKKSAGFGRNSRRQVENGLDPRSFSRSEGSGSQRTVSDPNRNWGMSASINASSLREGAKGYSDNIQRARKLINEYAESKGKPAPYKRGLFSSKLKGR